MPLQHDDYQGITVKDLLEIYSHLSPERAMVVSAVDQHSRNSLLTSRVFWEKKYKLHFPDRYEALAKNINTDWYAEFRSAYSACYLYMSAHERLLFSLVKESDIHGLRKMGMTMDVLSRMDRDGIPLTAWARRVGDQSVLDYFYELVCANYMTADQDSVDVTMVNNVGRTILYWALACGQSLETIKSLLSLGSRFDESYRYEGYIEDQSPFIHLAAKFGRLDVVRLIIGSRPDLLERLDTYGQTPLHWAARMGHGEVVDYLLYQGANLAVASNGVDVLNSGNTALHWAAANGHVGVMHSLIRAGADVAATAAEIAQRHRQPIHLAARQNQLGAVQVLMEARPDLLEQTDTEGRTPLLYAAEGGGVAVVDFLVKQGASLTAATNNLDGSETHGRTALHLAALRGHSEVVGLLVKLNADVKAVSGDLGRQPIHLAAEFGCLAAVQVLIESHPDLLEQRSADGQTPLLLAAMKGRDAVVGYLIDQQADINALINRPGHETHGRTPLYWAARFGLVRSVSLLMDAGADATLASGSRGSQPLHVAVRHGNLDVVQEIIKHQPDLIEQVDGDGKTPLMLAAVNGDAGEVLAALMNAGAATTMAGGTLQYQAIHAAVKNGTYQALVTLIEKQPNLLEQPDAYGQTPLLLAAAAGHLDKVRYLIAKGANINTATRMPEGANHVHEGKTPLCWAAENGHDSVVSCLLDAGADPSIACAEGLQPFHLAVREGHLDVVLRMLARQPALLEKRDAHGETPLMIAASYGRAEMVSHLLGHDANSNASINRPGHPDHGKTALCRAVELGHRDAVEMFLNRGRFLGVTKSLKKCQLNKRLKSQLRLGEYISRRNDQPRYKKSFTIFGHRFNFGFSRERKLAAANALKNVYIYGAHERQLAEYKKELNNGDLGAIYRRLRVR